MFRVLAAPVAACCVMVGLVSAPAPAAAQQWNDARTRALVARATALRAQQLADTALVDYTATAHGYVTFLAQLGNQAGQLTEPPKVVRTDQLALQVYWHAPNLSKQMIIGRRDTLLAPTDIRYHRDHLGIVQNNFPSIIRIGEGDEVRDVPHPLSATGLADYDFAITDSLQILLPDRAVDVYAVQVRPRDPAAPRVVGAIYLDRSTAQVVRMAFSFTRDAYIDHTLDDVDIVLENALVAGRFWLPRHQEIEIRRSGTWLDFPARGIIRGRWEICCYHVNTGLPSTMFAGPAIIQLPPSVLSRYAWRGSVLDSLPRGVRAATGADVQRVQAQVRSLVRARVLQKTTGPRLTARRISDFARVNRVEGLALGGGAALPLGSGRSLALAGRWGFADHQAKGRVSLDVPRAGGDVFHLYAERQYRDARDVEESSLVRNSLAAQEYGDDNTEPYDVRAVGVGAELGQHLGMWWRAEASYETQRALSVHARPAMGQYAPVFPARPVREGRLSLDVDRPTTPFIFGSELRLTGELRGGIFQRRDSAFTGSRPRFARAVISADIERAVGAQRLVLRSVLGAVAGSPAAPPQEYIFLGGPTTGPGYGAHEFAARLAASQRVEWRVRVPFVPIPLGRFGRAPASATLAPFVNTIYVARSAPFRAARGGWYPSVGLGALFFFDLLRVDVARGVRDGRWSVSFDIAREFWGIL
ncbi:MAG TPA: hypothetical protein VFW98_13050 [Gemmatimonadaceae bacterium]|nr:hypothetical protein [Gemmatimonadaceae bacterium]